jgi:hypothetical protein
MYKRTALILVAAVAGLLALSARADFQPKAEKVVDNVYAIIGPLGQRSPDNDGLNANYRFRRSPPEGVILIDSGASAPRCAQKLTAAIRRGNRSSRCAGSSTPAVRITAGWATPGSPNKGAEILALDADRCQGQARIWRINNIEGNETLPRRAAWLARKPLPATQYAGTATRPTLTTGWRETTGTDLHRHPLPRRCHGSGYRSTLSSSPVTWSTLTACSACYRASNPRQQRPASAFQVS